MSVKAILEFYNHIIATPTVSSTKRLGSSGWARRICPLSPRSEENDLDPFVLCEGIITLGDILEDFMQIEICDEFDNKYSRDSESDPYIIAAQYSPSQ